MADLRAEVVSLAGLLADRGLEHAFGITGSGPTLALITELDRRGVHYHNVSHEACAAIMAGVVSRMTGRPSASISIKGPGLANMLSGIVTNSLENAPALSISEAFGPEAPRYRKHKRIDQQAAVAPFVKASASLSDLSSQVGALLDTAFAEVPGPVHLDLCFDPARAAVPRPIMPPRDPAAAKTALDTIGAATRPIVIAGSLALRRPWGARLGTLSAPIFTTVAAKGVIDEGSDWSAGVFTGDGKSLAPEAQLFANADLVVGFGLRNNEILSAKSFGRPTVLIDEVAGDLTDGFGAETVWTSATPEDAATAIDLLAAAAWGAAEVRAARATLERGVDGAAWLPAACFAALNGAFEHTLVLDTGSFCTIGEHMWIAGPRRKFLGSSNARSMGVGLPSAIGAALAGGGTPVVAALGDGGMRMYPSEMNLAISRKLPLAVILMSDGRYGSIACVPQPAPVKPELVSVPGTSWWRAVEGMGCASRPVSSRAELEAALAGWDRNGPIFLEATFAPEPYGAMTRDLR